MSVYVHTYYNTYRPAVGLKGIQIDSVIVINIHLAVCAFFPPCISSQPSFVEHTPGIDQAIMGQCSSQPSFEPEHESLLNQLQTRTRPAVCDSLCLDRIDFSQVQGIRNLSLIKIPWVLRVDHYHENPRPVLLVNNSTLSSKMMPTYPDCQNPKTKHHMQRISPSLTVCLWLPIVTLPTPIDLER